MEIKLTDENFDAEVLKSDKPILVDFWAQWCGPCLTIAPTLAKLAEKYEGKMKVGKLNVDEHPALAEKYQIRGIPNMKFFKNGQIAGEVVGLVAEKELEAQIEKYI